MDEAKRSVDHTPQDFLAAWWRGKAGPVPCAGCSACCYYAGIPVDKKRDRSRLPYLLSERNHDGELVLQRRADGACARRDHLRVPDERPPLDRYRLGMEALRRSKCAFSGWHWRERWF